MLWWIVIVFASLFGYSMLVTIMQISVYSTTDWDNADSWAIGAFWPVTTPIWFSWMVVTKIPSIIHKRYINNLKHKKTTKEESRRKMYSSVDIPKGDIRTVEEYRRLGQVAEELKK